MSLERRVSRLEQSVDVEAGGAGESVCRCEDAASLVDTSYHQTCYRSGAPINLHTWKHWQTFYPDSAETNYFAFGLRRDDAGALTGKPNGYFLTEVSDVLRRWHLMARAVEGGRD